VVVQRGCAKWSARVITNWLLILNTPPAVAAVIGDV